MHSTSQRHFLSTEHLGTEAIAAFVDNELPPRAMRRAQAHLMACPECRSEVAKQRQAARRLRDSQEIHVPANLRARLAAMNAESMKPMDSSATSAAQPDASHLAHRRPESLTAAFEQVVRNVRRGGNR